MFKSIILGLFSAILVASGAFAQTCPSYTYTFSSGSTAVASQVNANFASILTCANNSLAPLASPHFTGNVGIGTSSPSNAILTLVAPGASAQSGMQVNASGSGGRSYRLWTTDASNGEGPGLLIISDSTSGLLDRIAVTSMGSVGIGTSSPSSLLFVNGTAGGIDAWSSPSDARIKTDIKQINDALSLIERLRGVRYRWKPASERDVGKDLKLAVDEPQIGFIAQEVASVVPEAVVTPKKETTEKLGKDKGGADVYGLKEGKLIPILVEAVKEQQAEIEALKTEIAALKSAKAPAH